MSRPPFNMVQLLLTGKKTETEEIEESRKSLFAELTVDQISQVEIRRALWIVAKDGKRYLVWHDEGLIQESNYSNQWYLRIRGVNQWDELAIKKGWLERAPEEILAAAKKIEFETERPKGQTIDFGPTTAIRGLEGEWKGIRFVSTNGPYSHGGKSFDTLAAYLRNSLSARLGGRVDVEIDREVEFPSCVIRTSMVRHDTSLYVFDYQFTQIAPSLLPEVAQEIERQLYARLQCLLHPTRKAKNDWIL